MTNKLVVIINSPKVPKIKKNLLYEMKFLVPNYSCLQNPWLGGYRPQIPVLSVLCPQLNLLNPPPTRTKFLGTPLTCSLYFYQKLLRGAIESKCLKYIRPLLILETLIPALSAPLKMGCAGNVSQGFGLSTFKMDYDSALEAGLTQSDLRSTCSA